MTENRQASCAALAIGLTILGALIAKATMLFWPTPNVELMTPAEGLVEVESAQEASALAGAEVYMPSELFGASVETIGVYTTDANGIPHGSVSIILARNGWRMVEIFEQDGAAWDRLHAMYADKSERVAIGSTEGLITDISSLSTRCIAGKDGAPGACKLTNLLLFRWNDRVISIAADGEHATSGELIALARSLVAE